MKAKRISASLAGAPGGACGDTRESWFHFSIWKFQQIIDSFKNVTSQIYRVILLPLSAEHRNTMVFMESDLSNRFLEIVVQQFSWIFQLPCRIAGIDGGRVDDEEGSHRILVGVVEEFERRQEDGAYRIIHRKARRWWERHGSAAKRLVVWMSGGVACRKPANEDIAALMIDVKKIALLPLTSQWIEGAHAQVKQYTDSHRRSHALMSKDPSYPLTGNLKVKETRICIYIYTQ